MSDCPRRLTLWQVSHIDGSIPMAKFMDVHSGFHGVTPEQLDEAHCADLKIEAGITLSSVVFAHTKWRCQLSLERLPQALFEMRAEAATDPSTRSAFEEDVELTMRNRFELLDILEIHEGRTMHADESCRVKSCCEFSQWRAVEQFPSTGRGTQVKIDVNPGCFDPFDVRDAEKTRDSS